MTMPAEISSPDLTDRDLLAKYAGRRDAGAFAKLVRRYGPLVYGTSLRVTRSAADAEDVCQDCFLELARRSAQIAGSLPAWLHTTARNRALDLLRSTQRRRRREQAAEPPLSGEGAPDWSDISGMVDEAIAALPDDLREPIVRHYLQGQGQADVAAALGVSQGTISRRLGAAIEALRDRLQQAGTSGALSATVLATTLERSATVTMPSLLAEELGKMAVAGPAPIAGSMPLRPITLLLAAGAIVAVVAVGIVIMGQTASTAPSPSSPAQENTMPASQRLVLDGVPTIGYAVRPCPLPGSVESVMRFVGEPVDYDILMGVSGAAFRRIWNRDDGGNVDLMYFSPEPEQRIFKALGYEYTSVPWQQDAMIQAIKQSISAGRPLISFGIIGPPEAGVITGYADDGQTLIGWNYFQKTQGKYYEQKDWYERMKAAPKLPDADLGPQSHAGIGLIVLGSKTAKPDDRQMLRGALEWAVDLSLNSRRPNLPNHVCGLAAYDAWAAGLEVDADYPANDKAAMEWRRMVHGDQCTMLGERTTAAAYLRKMVRVAPEAADELNAAAGLYDEVAGYGSQMRGWDIPTLSDPQSRREIAAAVRMAREAEAEAVTHLEKALGIIEATMGP
jgi:RNA polymerase sigma factor (sigma-70 family)